MEKEKVWEIKKVLKKNKDVIGAVKSYKNKEKIIILSKTENPLDLDYKNIEVVSIRRLFEELNYNRYNKFEEIVYGETIYDIGILEALKKLEIFKKVVLSQFGEYILSIILFGSLGRGELGFRDIDVAIIIDDTDVKDKEEIKEQLKIVFWNIASHIDEKLNVNIYLLTEFWEWLKDGNPVIYTLIRDGVSIFDKGLFLPWKGLLKMGKIKPTPEAIKILVENSKLVLKNTKKKITELVIEHIYYSFLQPAQALLMLLGFAPPTHKETLILFKKYVVEKGLMSKKYYEWLKSIVNLRKNVESEKKTLNGMILEEWLNKAEKYQNRILKLIEEIQVKRMKDEIEEIKTLFKEKIINLLKLFKIGYEDPIKTFKEELVDKGLVPRSFYESLYLINELERYLNKRELTEEEIQKIRKKILEDLREIDKIINEVLDEKNIEKVKKVPRIKIKHKNGVGEVIIFKDKVFITDDIKNPVTIWRYEIKDKRLVNGKLSSLEEMEKEKEGGVLESWLIKELEKIYGGEIRIII